MTSTKSNHRKYRSFRKVNLLGEWNRNRGIFNNGVNQKREIQIWKENDSQYNGSWLLRRLVLENIPRTDNK